MKKSLPYLTAALFAAFCGTADATPVTDLWDSCRFEVGQTAGEFYRVRTFGRERETSNRMLQFIETREKTVTFSLPWTYTGDQNATPVVGGYSVVTDLDGKPRFILRTTSIKTLPYKDVTAEDSQYEGPGVRTLEAWRKVHWDFFTVSLQPLKKIPTEDMPVTVERFEVVCKPR